MKFTVTTTQPSATVTRTYEVTASSEESVRAFDGDWFEIECETENNDEEDIITIEAAD